MEFPVKPIYLTPTGYPLIGGYLWRVKDKPTHGRARVRAFIQ